MLTTTTPPAHVPAARVVDFDIFTVEETSSDPQAVYQQLSGPGMPDALLWTPRNGGHWLATRSQTARAVFEHPEHFSSRTLIVPKPATWGPPLMPIQADDPKQHDFFRSMLSSALSPRAVTALGEHARRLTVELIEGFRQRGHCEFVGEFAHLLPVAIFMRIVDLPESDRVSLSEKADRLLRGADESIRNMAMQELYGYAHGKIQERRNGDGSDLITHITRVRDENGQPVDDFTLTGMLTLLLIAGLDTVAAALGFVMRFLATQPERRQELMADPALIPNAVEELLRRYSVAISTREVVVDCELAGVQLKVGDLVVVPTCMDGLDDRRFDQPLAVDIHRPKPIHGAFGHGLHRCMGSMLARTEIRVVIEEWLARIPEFGIAPGADIKAFSRAVTSLQALPLVWDPASTGSR